MERIEASVKTHEIPRSPGALISFVDREHYSDRDWGPEMRGWADQMEAFLRENLGSGYVDRFQSAAGISQGPVWFNYEKELNSVLSDLSRYLARIEQFMRENPE